MILMIYLNEFIYTNHSQIISLLSLRLSVERFDSSQLYQSWSSMRTVPRTVQCCQIIDLLLHLPFLKHSSHLNRLSASHRSTHSSKFIRSLQLLFLIDNFLKKFHPQFLIIENRTSIKFQIRIINNSILITSFQKKCLDILNFV